MLDPDSFPFAFDIVAKTIEVTVTLHGEETRLRMEALRSEGGTYSKTAYVEREIQLRHPLKHPDDVGYGDMAWRPDLGRLQAPVDPPARRGGRGAACSGTRDPSLLRDVRTGNRAGECPVGSRPPPAA